MQRDRSEEVRAIGIAFLLVPLITVLARCYVRIYMIKNFAIDDWLAVVTMVFMAAYAALIIASASTGVGRHEALLTVNQKIVSMKMYVHGNGLFSYVLNQTAAGITESLCTSFAVHSRALLLEPSYSASRSRRFTGRSSTGYWPSTSSSTCSTLSSPSFNVPQSVDSGVAWLVKKSTADRT